MIGWECKHKAQMNPATCFDVELETFCLFCLLPSWSAWNCSKKLRQHVFCNHLRSAPSETSKKLLRSKHDTKHSKRGNKTVAKHSRPHKKRKHKTSSWLILLSLKLATFWGYFHRGEQESCHGSGADGGEALERPGTLAGWSTCVPLRRTQGGMGPFGCLFF